VCDALGVALEVVPLTQAYWEGVVSDSVAQIRAGRTPNPDMLCNSRVKFGAFIDLLEARGDMAGGAVGAGTATATAPPPAAAAAAAAAAAEGSAAVAALDIESPAERMRFDRVASGHYARVVREPAGSAVSTGRNSGNQCGAAAQPQGQASAAAAAAAAAAAGGAAAAIVADAPRCSARLALSADAVKDQSYFLAQLSPRQLSHTLFPLGGLTKAQVDGWVCCRTTGVVPGEVVRIEWDGLPSVPIHSGDAENTHTHTHTHTHTRTTRLHAAPQVRQLATSAGLATQARKDSQGICFLGKVGCWMHSADCQRVRLSLGGDLAAREASQTLRCLPKNMNGSFVLHQALSDC